MVFCNMYTGKKKLTRKIVTILILIDGFLQSKYGFNIKNNRIVTILILIDGFLQYCSEWETMGARMSQSLF